MRSLKKLSIISALATTAVLQVLSSSASAFTLNSTNNTNTLLNELLGNTSGLSNFQVTTTGDSRAFGTFNSDPFGLGSGIVLSTGDVTHLAGPNNSGSTTTDLTGPDSITLDISFDADHTADKLFFSYVFGSEEFLEYAGSGYNDSFTLSLNGTNLALLNNGDTVTINNLAGGSSGPFSPNFIDNSNGSVQTELDGYTTVLGFEGLLNKNATNTLSINIQDVGDSSWDSAVFIKGNSLSTVNPTAVPEPGTVVGLLVTGVLAGLSRRFKAAFR